MIGGLKRVLFGSRLRCEEYGETLDSNNEITLPITGKCDDCRSQLQVIYKNYDPEAREALVVWKVGDRIEVHNFDGETGFDPTTNPMGYTEPDEPEVVYDLERDVFLGDLEECERCGYESDDTAEIDVHPSETYCIDCMDEMSDRERREMLVAAAISEVNE